MGSDNDGDRVLVMGNINADWLLCWDGGGGGGLLVVQCFLWATHWEVLSGSPGDQTQRGGLAGDTRVRYLTVTARGRQLTQAQGYTGRSYREAQVLLLGQVFTLANNRLYFNQ